MVTDSEIISKLIYVNIMCYILLRLFAGRIDMLAPEEFRWEQPVGPLLVVAGLLRNIFRFNGSVQVTKSLSANLRLRMNGPAILLVSIGQLLLLSLFYPEWLSSCFVPDQVDGFHVVKTLWAGAVLLIFAVMVALSRYIVRGIVCLECALVGYVNNQDRKSYPCDYTEDVKNGCKYMIQYMSGRSILGFNGLIQNQPPDLSRIRAGQEDVVWESQSVNGNKYCQPEFRLAVWRQPNSDKQSNKADNCSQNNSVGVIDYCLPFTHIGEAVQVSDKTVGKRDNEVCPAARNGQYSDTKELGFLLKEGSGNEMRPFVNDCLTKKCHPEDKRGDDKVHEICRYRVKSFYEKRKQFHLSYVLFPIAIILGCPILNRIKIELTFIRVFTTGTFNIGSVVLLAALSLSWVLAWLFEVGVYFWASLEMVKMIMLLFKLSQ
ncbi:MAG: hypothetical protein K6T65_13480 [Peptococcaceae bacterium]|nr:hypothetical protein [Peptococcaceae bacterium]